MENSSKDSPNSKIGLEFQSRLSRAAPGDRIRAIIVLDAASQSQPRAVRLSRKDREKALRQLKEAAKEMLPEIDNILISHHGKRLTEDIDALGTIYIETNVEGLIAMAQCDKVKAILDDQNISLLSFKAGKAKKPENR